MGWEPKGNLPVKILPHPLDTPHHPGGDSGGFHPYHSRPTGGGDSNNSPVYPTPLPDSPVYVPIVRTEGDENEVGIHPGDFPTHPPLPLKGGGTYPTGIHPHPSTFTGDSLERGFHSHTQGIPHEEYGRFSLPPVGWVFLTLDPHGMEGEGE